MNYGIAVPDWVRANMEREEFLERQGYQATVLKQLLKDLDPQLDLVWVKEKALPLPGLTPARWHVRRRNKGAPDTYFAITQEDGGYMEPHAGIIDQLKQADLSRVGNMGAFLRERREREQRVKDKKQSLRAEQRQDHMAEDFRAAKRVAGENLEKRRWGAS